MRALELRSIDGTNLQVLNQRDTATDRHPFLLWVLEARMMAIILEVCPRIHRLSMDCQTFSDEGQKRLMGTIGKLTNLNQVDLDCRRTSVNSSAIAPALPAILSLHSLTLSIRVDPFQRMPGLARCRVRNLSLRLFGADVKCIKKCLVAFASEARGRLCLDIADVGRGLPHARVACLLAPYVKETGLFTLSWTTMPIPAALPDLVKIPLGEGGLAFVSTASIGTLTTCYYWVGSGSDCVQGLREKVLGDGRDTKEGITVMATRGRNWSAEIVAEVEEIVGCSQGSSVEWC